MAQPRLRKIDGRTAVLVTGLSVVPPLLLLLGVGATSVADVVPGVAMVSYAVVLGAAALTYLHWRMTPARADNRVSARLAAWLTVGLTATAVEGMLLVAPLDEGPGGAPDHWSAVTQLGLLLVLCPIAAIAERVDAPADPALMGAVSATGITGVSAVALLGAPPLVLSGTGAALLNTAVMLAGLGLAWILLHRTQVSMWARRRLAVSTILLTAAQCSTNLGWQHASLASAAMAAYLLGALLLCLMTHQLLRRSILDHQAELDLLQQSLVQVRAAVLEDRELLHEVGATLAGITSASEVMRQGKAVPAHRRQRLEAMLVAELARLERLMLTRSSGADGEDREIDVDATVEPIVTSHLARGRDVRWTASGAHSFGDADELAEVVNILLENAARHARGSVVRLSVDVVDDGVVVICSDSGPGVPHDLRGRLFDPEVRRPGSPGQGLGLAIAHRLATARGGSLELVDDDRPGATFVARLPWKEMAHDAARRVA
jgi:signal transduction histidine kinase